MKKPFIIGIFTSIILVSCQGLAVPVFSAKNGYYSITVEKTEKGQILSLSGDFAPNSSPRDAKAAIGYLEKDKNLILVLNSGGGNLMDFYLFLNKLQSASKYIIAYVPDGAQCTSACILLFLGADYRMASVGARFGFHGAQDNEDRPISLDEMYDQLRRLKASKKLLTALKENNSLSSTDLTYFSAAEMESLSSVDELVETEYPVKLKVNTFRLEMGRCSRALRGLFEVDRSSGRFFASGK